MDYADAGRQMEAKDGRRWNLRKEDIARWKPFVWLK